MQMGRMEMDCNLQTLGSIDSFNFFLMMILEYFVYRKRYLFNFSTFSPIKQRETSACYIQFSGDTFFPQLSSLTVELASQRRGGSSFNPQAAVVKQLQDEVLRLRTQLASGQLKFKFGCLFFYRICLSKALLI